VEPNPKSRAMSLVFISIFILQWEIPFYGAEPSKPTPLLLTSAISFLQYLANDLRWPLFFISRFGLYAAVHKDLLSV
jgi:hypothetical protein